MDEWLYSQVVEGPNNLATPFHRETGREADYSDEMHRMVDVVES